jgi:hypothetical protein
VQNLDQQVIAAIGRHPLVRTVQLVGSRAQGRATTRSDWDFLIDSDDFHDVARDLRSLSAPLQPIAQQWDRLSSHYCWMLMLRGPTKIDLIFGDQPHQREPPWEPRRENVPGIDLHFWDWMLWLGGKEAAGQRDLVATELEKLYEHLLAPLGVRETPESLPAAIAAYGEARAQAEQRLGIQVPRDLEDEVLPTLGV